MKKAGSIVRPVAVEVKDPVPIFPSWTQDYAGNTAMVTIAWSPEGPVLPSGCSVRVAYAGPDYTVQVWNVGDSERPGQVLRYQGHSDALSALAWSPDGTVIASASEDRTVQIWDVSPGTAIMSLSEQEAGVRALAWSPDSKLLAVGSDDNTVQVLYVAEERCCITYHGHVQGQYGVDALTWSPDGTRIASAGDDNTVQVWDALTGRLQVTYRGHSNSWVLAVAWSPDGRWIVSAGNEAQVWDALTGECVQVYSAQSHALNWIDNVAWSSDSRLIASTSVDAMLHVWDALSGKNSHMYAHMVKDGGFEGIRANALAWSPVVSGTQECVVFASYDGTVSLCRME